MCNSFREVQGPGRTQIEECVKRFCGRSFVSFLMCLAFGYCLFGQDVGSQAREYLGDGSVIAVMVHDASGGALTSLAEVKLLRGITPSGQVSTTRGEAEFVVTNLGEFTVVVSAPGYAEAQKDINVISGRTQVDLYLRRSSSGGVAGVPGRPVLAPKAKEALDKGLQALKENKLGGAEKYVGEAMRMAPGNPDVLYVEGVLSLKEGKWEQAQGALKKATEMDPNSAPAFAALGMALCDRGSYGEAVGALTKSLQLDAAGTWETRWALAKSYYQLQQYEEALKLSQESLEKSNGSAPQIALLVAQSLSAVGRYEDAARMLRAFLKEHGDRPEAGIARGWLERLAASRNIRGKMP